MSLKYDKILDKMREKTPKKQFITTKKEERKMEVKTMQLVPSVVEAAIALIYQYTLYEVIGYRA